MTRRRTPPPKRPAAAVPRRRPAFARSRRGRCQITARAAVPRRRRRSPSSSRAVTWDSRSSALRTCTAASRATKAVGDLREALHVRPEQNRLPDRGRLKDVVSAGRHQAAPHEDARRSFVHVGQLPDRVEDDDVRRRASAFRQRRAAGHPVARRGRDPRRLPEALGVPRRQDEQSAGVALARPCEGPEHRLLLAAQGAGGDHDRPGCRAVGAGQHGMVRGSFRGRDRRRVELEAPGDRDARGVGAEPLEPAPPLLGLHADAVEVPHHAPHEPAGPAVAAERAGGQPAVGERGAYAAAAARPQQVGPDLGVDHDQQIGRGAVESARDERRQVERGVERGVDQGAEAARDLLPGRRRRREQPPVSRIGVPQRREERPGGERLADRDRVHPDGRPPLRIDGARQPAAPLAQVAERLAVAPGRPGDGRQAEQDVQEQQRVVQQVHRRRASEGAGRRRV